MKTRQDNNMTDLIDLAFVETKTKLLGLVWLGTVCD